MNFGGDLSADDNLSNPLGCKSLPSILVFFFNRKTLCVPPGARKKWTTPSLDVDRKCFLWTLREGVVPFYDPPRGSQSGFFRKSKLDS